MPTNINADTLTGGAIITGDTSGVLQLQSGGSTKLTVNGSGVSLATPLPVASGGTGSSTGVNLASAVTGTLPIANGGTNSTATPTAGAIPYGTGTAFAFTAAGSAGQVLTSNGSSAPTWGTVSSSNVGDVLYSTQAPSASWLACNGATYLQSAYPALYAKLGILGTPYAPIWTSYQQSYITNCVIYNSSDSKYYAPMRVAGQSTGAIWSSTDGISWTSLTNSNGQQPNLLAYTAGRFVGYSSNFKLFVYTSAYPFSTSTTFNTWDVSSIFNPGSYNAAFINAIAVNRSNGDVMLVGQTTSNTYSYRAAIATANMSAPTTWTNVTPPNSADAYTITDVATDGAGTYVIMYSGQTTLYRSTNLGASWASTIPDGNTVYSIGYSNGFFYATTWSGSGLNTMYLYRSSNGSTWTLAASFPQSGTTLQQNIYNVLYSNANAIRFSKTVGSLVIYGYNPSSYNNCIFSSGDNGTTWNAVPHNTGLVLTSMAPQKNDMSFANSRIFVQAATSAPSYYNFQSIGYTYDASTQFVVPNYGSLSTFSSTYAAPVSAFIKAA